MTPPCPLSLTTAHRTLSFYVPAYRRPLVHPAPTVEPIHRSPDRRSLGKSHRHRYCIVTIGSMVIGPLRATRAQLTNSPGEECRRRSSSQSKSPNWHHAAKCGDLLPHLTQRTLGINFPTYLLWLARGKPSYGFSFQLSFPRGCFHRVGAQPTGRQRCHDPMYKTGIQPSPLVSIWTHNPIRTVEWRR